MHHLFTHNPGTGRKETGTSAANQPCKGGSKKKPTTQNLTKKVATNEDPFIKESAGGSKREKDTTKH